MNFTPKINVGVVVGGILTIAVVGLIGPVSRVAPAPAPIAASQDAVPIVHAVEIVQAPGLQTAEPGYYQPIAKWYKSKRWWKKHAPVVGGAAGGGVVGGLVGGPAGAVIGGAAGGGAGYLYKRHKHRQQYRHRR